MALRNTWAERDLPVLTVVVGRVEEGADFVGADEIATELGVDVAVVNRSLRALEDAGYLSNVLWVMGGGAHVSRITERARREVGTWPSADSVVDRLIDALSQAESAEPDVAKRDTIVATRKAISGFLRDVTVGVIAGQIGSPR